MNELTANIDTEKKATGNLPRFVRMRKGIQCVGCEPATNIHSQKTFVYVFEDDSPVLSKPCVNS